MDVSPESAPLLKFTPGNVTVQAVMDVQAFVVLANSSVRKSVFQLRVVSLTQARRAKGHACWGAKSLR